MPGLNQRGPENMGPMTGRKMGRCVTETTTAGQGFGPGMGQGYGFGGGFGRGRGCGRGFGRGRGGGWAAPAAPGSYAPGPAAPVTKEDLSLRAQALEQELEAVKKQLKGVSED